jgi:SAM-dependent methyltransferase
MNIRLEFAPVDGWSGDPSHSQTAVQEGIGVKSSPTRRGRSILEFLRYYVLEMLKKAPMTSEGMIEAIERESAGNEKYRQGGTLHIARSDLDRVLESLTKEGLVRTDGGGRSHLLTPEGKTALEEMEAAKAKAKDSKERAATKLMSILLSDARGDTGGRNVLDVGTGEGYLALKAADAGFQVLGIDSSAFEYSRDSVAKAQQQADSNPNVQFRSEDVRDMEGKEIFDYVISSQATHCMGNQMGCIASIYTLLKGGGLLIASDFLVGLGGYFAHGFHCFLALSKEEWKEVLAETGYVDVRIHEVGDFCVVEARKPSGSGQEKGRGVGSRRGKPRT